MAALTWTIGTEASPPLQGPTGLELLDDCIDLLSSGTYAVLRKSVETPEGGYLSDLPGLFNVGTVTMSVQPMTGLDMQAMPEGRKNDEGLTGFATSELKTANDGLNCDIILVDGQLFDVVNVQRWNKLGNYWKVLLARQPS